MSDIWNLSALCRCCHIDGSFKSLEVPYTYKNEVEVYSVMLQETLGVSISKPPENMSYSICDVCIYKLRETLAFKLQILTCEEKFNEYLQNEQALNKDIKLEIDPCEYSVDDDIVVETESEIKHEEQHDSDIGNFHEMDDFDSDLKNEEIIQELGSKEIIKASCDKVKSKRNPTRTTRSCSDIGNIDEIDDFDSDLKNEEITQELDSKDIKKASCHKIKSKKNSTRTTRSSKLKNSMKPKQENTAKLKNLKKPKQENTAKLKNSKKPEQEETETLFPCNQCESFFPTMLRLRRHLDKSHPPPAAGTPYTCTHCSEEFTHIDHIYEHIKTHDTDKVKCRFCDKHFRVKSTQQCHENTIHIRKCIFICNICNKNFSYKATLSRHLLWHSGMNKKVFCETCGHGFNDNTNLRSHVEAVHLQIRKFGCTKCNKTFKAKKHLKTHNMIHHNGEKPYKCPQCPATYCDYRAFTEHKMTHKCKNIDPKIDITKRVYHCKSCPEIFDNRSKFKAHVMRHNRDGSSPNICHICGRCFSCKYSMNRHVANHSGLKRFPCDICQKGFSQKAQLLRHKRSVHDPVKKERTKCPICKINVRDIEKHQKRHEIRPFSCETCSRSYPQKNALNRHVKEAHFGIFKHVCSICNTKCKTAKLLAKHKSTVHHVMDYEFPLEIELK